MQALTQPKGGSGYPSQAIARSKWRRIFYLLTAFNIVTVSGALYLTYRLLTQEVIEEMSLLILSLSNAIKYTPLGGRISIGKACGKAGL